MRNRAADRAAPSRVRARHAGREAGQRDHREAAHRDAVPGPDATGIGSPQIGRQGAKVMLPARCGAVFCAPGGSVAVRRVVWHSLCAGIPSYKRALTSDPIQVSGWMDGRPLSQTRPHSDKCVRTSMSWVPTSQFQPFGPESVHSAGQSFIALPPAVRLWDRRAQGCYPNTSSDRMDPPELAYYLHVQDKRGN